MFEGLQTKLQAIFRSLRAEGRVSEEQLRTALRQIRLALLEADVHFRVVRSFLDRVREQALGQKVLDSLTPAQQILKIVRDELTELLGGESQDLRLSRRPAVIVLCGLQGSGKTTTAGKLGYRLRAEGRRPLLVAADLRRAAAVEQLRQVGEAAGVEVLGPETGESPLGLGERAVAEARAHGYDALIVDTAGRLHVDEPLMEELHDLVGALQPEETLLVADSMTGQDAVNMAREFSRSLPLTGVILTKLDGDARGGAALSIRSQANVPIRLAGTGERLEDLELFHPQRMASRILGMGDMLSLIEKAERAVTGTEMERLAQRIAHDEFSFEDLREQLRQMRRLGPLPQLLEMLPRVGPLRGLETTQVDEGKLRRIEALINSMTPAERRQPRILNASRKRRIARGSGTSVQELNQLIQQQRAMRRLFKQVKGQWLRRAVGKSR